MKMYIYLNQQEKVERFVTILLSVEGKFELSVNGRTVDARSALDIFCLDLSKQLLLTTDLDIWPEQLTEFITLSHNDNTKDG